MVTKSTNCRRTLLVYAAAFTVGLLAWSGPEKARALDRIVAPPSAEEIAAAMQPADLEKAFWLCDYTATTRGIDATPVAICSAVWDEFKQTRFAGSFEDPDFQFRRQLAQFFLAASKRLLLCFFCRNIHHGSEQASTSASVIKLYIAIQPDPSY